MTERRMTEIFFALGDKSLDYEGRILGLIEDVGLQGLMSEKGLARKIKTAESIDIKKLAVLDRRDMEGRPGGLKGRRLVIALRRQKFKNKVVEIYDKLLVTNKIAHMDSFTMHPNKHILTLSFLGKEKSWLVIEEHKEEGT